MSLNIDPKATALVIIDLQKGIVSRPLAPHDAGSVVKKSVQIAEALLKAVASWFPCTSPSRPTMAIGSSKRSTP